MRVVNLGLGRSIARRLHLGAALGIAGYPATVAWLYGGTDKGEHGYFQYYRKHLGPRRFARNVVFEIGVGGYESRAAGGSLAVWRDYLTRSTIVGIDLYDKDIRWGKRVQFTRADQNNPDELQAAVRRYGAPDIVIDDGSHIGEHIVSSFRALWPHLNPDGVYVIEDLLASYNSQWGGAEPPPEASGVGLARELIDASQALDPLSSRMGGKTATPFYTDVASVHTYPGIAFIEKCRDRH